MRVTKEEKLRAMIRMANPFINKNVTIYNPHPKALSFDIAGSILRIELVDMTQKTSRFNTNSVS
jgi:hypothetical protein